MEPFWSPFVHVNRFHLSLASIAASHGKRENIPVLKGDMTQLLSFLGWRPSLVGWRSCWRPLLSDMTQFRGETYGVSPGSVRSGAPPSSGSSRSQHREPQIVCSGFGGLWMRRVSCKKGTIPFFLWWGSVFGSVVFYFLVFGCRF